MHKCLVGIGAKDVSYLQWLAKFMKSRIGKIFWKKK